MDGFDPNWSPYQQRQPKLAMPGMSGMPGQPQLGIPQQPDDSQTQQPPMGGPDYLAFLSKMAAKKAF